MRILDVSQASPTEARDLSDHLIEAETVRSAFTSPTGAVLFTERRILIVQREHLLEERVETASWPYRAVRHFSIQESAGGRSALRVWLEGEEHPLHLRGDPGADLKALQRLLADKLS